MTMIFQPVQCLGQGVSLATDLWKYGGYWDFHLGNTAMNYYNYFVFMNILCMHIECFFSYVIFTELLSAEKLHECPRAELLLYT